MPTLVPFSITGTIQIPADNTLPPSPIPFSGSANAQSSSEQILNLSGSGTASIPFGTNTSPGVKGMVVRYDAVVGGQPVQLTINGSATPIELSPGGFFVFFSPTPSTGITSASIAYTAACQIRVWLLG